MMVVVTAAMTAVRPMAMTTIVMRSSTRLSPRSSCSRRISDLHLVEDAVHGRNEGDGDETDRATGDEDDGRLEEARKALELVVELAIEVRRGGRHLLVERAGVLTDAEHLAGGRWE